jgi:hypothetical protein
MLIRGFWETEYGGMKAADIRRLLLLVHCVTWCTQCTSQVVMVTTMEVPLGSLFARQDHQLL